jgi:pimeloyl-ACP methyl ester carboxylesterase
MSPSAQSYRLPYDLAKCADSLYEVNVVERAVLGGVTLEYEASGEGEPVVFIHGSFIADAFRPLLAEPSLRGHRLVAYHRRGYGGSSRLEGVVGVAEQATDCLALLRHLGIERTHVVGHSLGGVIALQLALDASEVVGTLAVLEPAMAVGESGPAYHQALANSSLRYREVGAATVVDETFKARWPAYRARLEDVLPGAFDQAVTDAPGMFESELPGLLAWVFGEDQARSITQPALTVIGGGSNALSPRFAETHRALCAWLPNAEAFILPGATHFLQIEKPRLMAEALASFFRSHPL